MKLSFLSVLLLGTSFIATAQQEEYELRVLTFEDKDYKGTGNYVWAQDWSTLIDDPQYGGLLLYGDGGYGMSEEDVYRWDDENNTFLSSRLCGSYGSYAYWTGGEAISNYGSSDIERYGTSEYQLTVYNRNADKEITRTGHGHNGSDNFAMHFGYIDSSGFGMTDELSTLSFSDGKARVIDHVWINNNNYALNCYLEGNGLTSKIGPEDWVKVVFTGYNGEEKTNTVDFYLCNGPENIITDWTKCDLFELGEVTKVTINITGSSDNGYGFSQPAYFAWDDMAVRFPKIKTGIEGAEIEENMDNIYYNLQGQRVENPTRGIYIRNGKKVVLR